MKIQATMFSNGVIRNESGEIIAFYDASIGILHIGGKEVRVMDAEHAMEIVGGAK